MHKFKLNHADTVLLIIDLQEKLMRVMKHKEKVYRNTQLLLEMAKQFSLPVIVCEQYPQGMGKTAESVSAHFPEDYYYFAKTSFSAYIEIMQEMLKKLARKTVIIAGSETHVCVFQSARDLVHAGYNVHLVSDAVCSRFEINYKNGLSLINNLGAIVTNTETVLFDLLENSDVPQFKKLAPLVK